MEKKQVTANDIYFPKYRAESIIRNSGYRYGTVGVEYALISGKHLPIAKIFNTSDKLSIETSNIKPETIEVSIGGKWILLTEFAKKQKEIASLFE
jgi:hypothetical protein